MKSVYHWRFADIKMSVNVALLGALLLCSFKTMIGCSHPFATLWLRRKSYENFRVASSKKELRGSILHLTLWRKWILLTKTILEKSTLMPWFVNFLGPELYFARVRYLKGTELYFVRVRYLSRTRTISLLWFVDFYTTERSFRRGSLIADYRTFVPVQFVFYIITKSGRWG